MIRTRGTITIFAYHGLILQVHQTDIFFSGHRLVLSLVKNVFNGMSQRIPIHGWIIIYVHKSTFIRDSTYMDG